MIRVEKEPNPPAVLAENTKYWQELLEKKGEIIRQSIYRHPTVVEELNRAYNSKCAYCETDTSAGAVMQVDHYRPKKRVTEEPLHGGYYWLAYEWSNLVYACSKCNREKSTKFPIKGERVYLPGLQGTALDTTQCNAHQQPLRNEQPCILHPEANDFVPFDHFAFQADGTIIGLSEQGLSTIECCKLNRSALVLCRKKIYDDAQRALNKYMDLFQIGRIDFHTVVELLKSVVEDILSRWLTCKVYSLFAQFLVFYFEEFFVVRYPSQEQQQALRLAYSRALDL